MFISFNIVSQLSSLSSVQVVLPENKKQQHAYPLLVSLVLDVLMMQTLLGIPQVAFIAFDLTVQAFDRFADFLVLQKQ